MRLVNEHLCVLRTSARALHFPTALLSVYACVCVYVCICIHIYIYIYIYH